MNQFRINRSTLSAAFYDLLFKHSEAFLGTSWQQISRDLESLENLRLDADYNTGSISPSAAFVLYSVCNYLQPSSIAEVGTFIGKSTLAMARAIEKNHAAVIRTCDFSNAIDLNLPTSTRVIQYKRTSATDMFSSMMREGLQTDVVFLDGRIQSNDLPLLLSLTHEKTVFIVDDFEGIEKGVSNTMLLLSQSNLKNHLLIYPPSLVVLEKLGFLTGCSMALIAPATLFSYTAQ